MVLGVPKLKHFRVCGIMILWENKKIKLTKKKKIKKKSIIKIFFYRTQNLEFSSLCGKKKKKKRADMLFCLKNLKEKYYKNIFL